MGNRITAKKEPVIMTENFLEEKIIQNLANLQDLDASELQKLVKTGGLEYDVIFSLDLEHQNLVNIDDLWRFQFLTKLEMPNNLLERIEGLESLVNLQILDLSFNFIKCIQNLENLVNLLHLNLTSNEITVLENMDSLQKLSTFLIRHNKLKSFDDINYLSRFKNLSSLAMGKNPVVDDEHVKLQILALLPHLKILDFNYVTSDQLKEALKEFPPKAPLEKNTTISHDVKEKFKCSFPDIDKEALVEGLANGQGFESLLLCEKNYQLLHSFPHVSHIAEEHCLKVTAIFDEWHDTGHKYYKEMLHEKSQFLSVVSKAKEYSLEVIREHEMTFISFKEQILEKLCIIYQTSSPDDEKDKNVAELKTKCDLYLRDKCRNFMNSTCLFIDIVTNIYQLYEKEISLLNSKYIQEIEEYIRNIMEINETYNEMFQEFYFGINDSGIDLSEEIVMKDGQVFEWNFVFLQLIKKKELIKRTLSLSLRFQSTMLKERMNNLKSSLYNDLKQNLNEVKEDAIIRQGEQARHTVIFCNKQRYFIDKLFSKSNVFNHYLGYR